VSTLSEIVAGLRALADFLEAHPDLPHPDYLDGPTHTVNTWWIPRGAAPDAIVAAAVKAGVPVRQDPLIYRHQLLDFGGVVAHVLVQVDELDTP
jgi:hypothetical protein